MGNSASTDFFYLAHKKVIIVTYIFSSLYIICYTWGWSKQKLQLKEVKNEGLKNAIEV